MSRRDRRRVFVVVVAFDLVAYNKYAASHSKGNLGGSDSVLVVGEGGPREVTIQFKYITLFIHLCCNDLTHIEAGHDQGRVTSNLKRPFDTNQCDKLSIGETHII